MALALRINPAPTLAALLLAACGGGGDSGGATASAPAAPTLRLAATAIPLGSSTTLTWSSVNATSCTASGSWSGMLAASGTKTLKPTALGTFTYTLACANSAGGSKASSATLTVGTNQVPAAPTLMLSANSIPYGSPLTITWSSINATSCFSSGGWNGTITPSGTLTFTETTAGTTTFTLTCANAAGTSKPSAVTVTVAPAPPPPTNLSYAPLQPFYYVNKPIIPLTPSVTGAVSAWQIDPSLPPGLTFNTATGVISGTATAASPIRDYIATARNPGGAVSVRLTFGVEIPPAFFYGSCSPQVALSTVQYTLGVAAQTLTPLIQGQCYGAYINGVEPWSITPALPAGLTINTTSGVISGTPTATSASTDYVITGGGPGGQTSVHMTIGVSSKVLLDLGHAAPLQSIQFDTAHVLSQDTTGHWVLWNYATMAQIASGDSAASAPLGGWNLQQVSVDLAGPTVAIVTSSGLELRSSAAGAVLAEISVPLAVWWWQLATDGSYVCAGGKGNLTCWSPTGQQLFAASGNYALAEVFAAPSALRIALGPAGADVIETVSSATWMSSVGAPFQGEFESWFVDGSAFLTRYNDSTVSVYSPAATLVDRTTVTTNQVLNGVGHWFWGEAGFPLNTLVLYAVGNSAMPTATYAVNSPTASGTNISWLSGTGPDALTAIDLSGATPVVSTDSVPAAESAYALNSSSHYMVGTTGGLLIDESTPGGPRTFDNGAVTNLAGGTARVVFTTAAGNTFSYNTTSNAFESTLDLSSSLQYVLSADAGVLATIEPGTVAGAETVDIYSLPSKALINSFSYASGSPSPQTITLSAPGTTLGELLSVSGVQQSLPVSGGAPTVYATQGAEPVQLSPNSTLVALSSTGQFPAARTALYTNGTYVTTVVGYAVGWLDNARLLVDTYNSQGTLIGANIFSPTGSLLAVAPFGAFKTLQVVSSDLVYAPQLNQVLSLSGANDGWASGDLCGDVIRLGGAAGEATTCFDAYAGSAVVFESGNLVLVQPY